MPNVFRSRRSRAVGTSKTVVQSYTVPVGATSTLIGMTLANITSSPITADVYVREAGGTGANDTAMLYRVPVPVGGTPIPIGGDQKVVLEAGESIVVLSSAASSLDVIVSLLEIS